VDTPFAGSPGVLNVERLFARTPTKGIEQAMPYDSWNLAFRAIQINAPFIP
jgi:hypothetical protein